MGRDTAASVNEVIVRLLNESAVGFVTNTMPSDLKRTERAIHLLETMLGIMDKDDYGKIQKLRERQKGINPRTTSTIQAYRDILIERMDVILYLLGRKGMLPEETREEIIAPPKSWRK